MKNLRLRRFVSSVVAIAMVLTMTGAMGFAKADEKVLKIPDENFRKEILTNANVLDNRVDPVEDGGVLAAGEKQYAKYNIYESDLPVLASVEKLMVSNKVISSLKGIEYFTGLKSLHCANNYLKDLDVSKNTKLESVFCYMNQLGSLDLSHNPLIKKAYYYGNDIGQIKLSNQVKSMEIWATGDGPIMYANVPSNPGGGIVVPPVVNPDDGDESVPTDSKKPGVIKILKAKNVGGKASLRWSRATDEPDGYRVYRAKSKNGKYSPIKWVKNGKAKTYKEKAKKSKKTYFYKVRAYKNTESGKVWGGFSPVKVVRF